MIESLFNIHQRICKVEETLNTVETHGERNLYALVACINECQQLESMLKTLINERSGADESDKNDTPEA